MNLKKLLCITLSLLLLPGISFAKKKKTSEDNPYGFEMVDESKKTSYEIEADENEDIDMDEVNRNDTYRAQSDADAAAIRKLERQAAELSKKTKPKIVLEDSNKTSSKESVKTRKPANKAAEIYYKFRYNPKVVKFLESLSYGWEKFKKWFVTLPGIRHYLASPYSKENYKKELGKVDYVEKKAKSDQLKKDSSSAKMLKKGSKEFFK